MTEPDVTLTDYALAVECLIFAVILHRKKSRYVRLGRWFTLFFASVCAASLFGGTVHGFFLDADSLGHAVLWPTSLLAIGLTAMTAWAIGAVPRHAAAPQPAANKLTKNQPKMFRTTQIRATALNNANKPRPTRASFGREASMRKAAPPAVAILRM